MINKDSQKLLEWMEKQDDWMTPAEISRKYKKYNDRSLKFLAKGKYLDSTFDPDGEQWVKYRISEKGKSYLASIRSKRIPELRDWISFAIPIVSFLAGLSLSDPLKAIWHWIVNLFD